MQERRRLAGPVLHHPRDAAERSIRRCSIDCRRARPPANKIGTNERRDNRPRADSPDRREITGSVNGNGGGSIIVDFGADFGGDSTSTASVSDEPH